jgi:hypothetical protein
VLLVITTILALEAKWIEGVIEFIVSGIVFLYCHLLFKIQQEG